MARGTKLIGLIAIADTVKDGAAEAIARLKQAGIEPTMLTGDNRRTANIVAEQVGIENVIAEVFPEEKAAKIRELQATGIRVAMVGDGINDSPALTQADVGIAIGAGTDIAIESADVVLIHSRLEGVSDAIAIGRTSYRKTVQNLILAFAFNGIGIPLAATGMVHPIWAMVASASRKCWRVRVAGCSEWNSFIEARKSAEPRGRFCGSSELVHHLTTEAL